MLIAVRGIFLACCEVVRGACVAAYTVGGTFGSLCNIVFTPPNVHGLVVGFGGCPRATTRRFHSPQPLPCGKLEGVVHLPMCTTGACASAPPLVWLTSDNDGARLDPRQPRS